MTKEQESITWIVGKNNCQVAVRNMPTDKMEKICAIIGEEGQQPCEDCISREAVMKCFRKWQPYMATRLWDYEQELKDLPSATPSYNSIKTELEPCEDCISRKAVLDLAKQGVLISNGSYESVCKAINELPPVMPKIQEWLSSFNTGSATVQELKKEIENGRIGKE